jgi:hypothetical protein
MAISFVVRFDPSSAYRTYMVRFRDTDVASPLDTKRIVPSSYWARLGHKMPRSDNPKLFALAHAWAADEVRRLNDERAANAAKIASRRMTVADVYRLYCAENPRLVSPATMKRDAVSYGAIGHHLDVETILPEDVTQPVAVRYRNTRRQDVTRSNEPARWRTIRNELDFLRRLVTFAFRWQSETGMTALRYTELPELEEDESLQVALTRDEVGSVLERIIFIYGLCTIFERRLCLHTATSGSTAHVAGRLPSRSGRRNARAPILAARPAHYRRNMAQECGRRSSGDQGAHGSFDEDEEIAMPRKLIVSIQQGE